MVSVLDDYRADVNVHAIVRYAPDCRRTYVSPGTSLTLGSLRDTVASGQLWAGGREVLGWSGDRGPEDHDGVVVLDSDGRPGGLLPVVGSNVLGWLDGETVLFSVYSVDASATGVVAWDFATGDLTRVASYHETATISVAGSHR